MAVKSAVFRDARGQRREKPAGRGIELAAGPRHRDARGDVEVFVGIGDGVIVIAENGDTATRDMGHDRLHGPDRVGSVTDMVPEEDEVPGAAGCGMREAGF